MPLLSFGCGCLLNLPQIKRSALHKIRPPPPQKINFPLKIDITLENLKILNVQYMAEPIANLQFV